MSTISLPLTTETKGKLRPLNIMRDLPEVADLVELCFQQNMDGEGKRYVQQIRDASHDRRYLRWASTSMPLLGFIWEDQKEIVGNISIVPFRKGNFLLANVAVHPDYRRQGIARRLTEKGMDYVRRRGAESIWVHVEEDNAGAIHLYESLGFHARALRTTWNASAQVKDHEPTNSIRKRPSHIWAQQSQWLSQAYPTELRWYRMPDFQIFSAGLKHWLFRVFMESDIRQWSVGKDGYLQAVLSWLPTHTRRAPLWLASAPQADAQSLTDLLLHARRCLLSQRSELYLDYPADQHVDAFQRAGFTSSRTLLWMKADGNV